MCYSSALSMGGSERRVAQQPSTFSGFFSLSYRRPHPSLGWCVCVARVLGAHVGHWAAPGALQAVPDVTRKTLRSHLQGIAGSSCFGSSFFPVLQ